MAPIYRTKRKHFPAGYDPDDCILVGIPCSLAGIFAGKISELEYRAEWESDEDWRAGYDAVVRWEAELMSCGQTIATQLDAITTLLTEWKQEQGISLLAIQQLMETLDTTSTSSLGVQNEITDYVDQIETILGY